MSTVDYTPVLLAQLTDLQLRVTKQDTTIAALKAAVERLSGQPVIVNDTSTMRTSIPLRSNLPDYKPRDRDNRSSYSRSTTNVAANASNGPTATSSRTRPRVAASNDKPARPTLSLSNVLKSGEEVNIHVHTGKDKSGDFIDSVAIATFDGTDLTITKCEDVPSLINMKSSKPGEILYKFIDELRSQGVINKTFTIAPWRLCFVERNGIKKSLEELRTTIG